MNSRAAALLAASAALLLSIPATGSAQSAARALLPTISARGQARPIAPMLAHTIAAQIPARRFWTEWERARRDASAVPQMRALVAPAIGLSPMNQIQYVQRAVSTRIRWRSDTTQWGRHDYWASAEETLKSGFGDGEDRAIVKMQALRTLGFKTSDLYLTLARDTVAGPLTVVVVRIAGKMYVLDEIGGPPFAAEARPEFHPVLTLGFGAFWAHIPAAGADSQL